MRRDTRTCKLAVLANKFWLAGAGGIEPPNGGIKIRCLTAWLRPNRQEVNRSWTVEGKVLLSCRVAGQPSTTSPTS